MKPALTFLAPWRPGGMRVVHWIASASILANVAVAGHGTVLPTHSATPPPWSGPIQPVAPAPPVKFGAVPLGVTPYWVGHVDAYDTGADLGVLVDEIAPQYGLPPVGLLSTLGAECGWKTGWPLNSFYDDCSRYGQWTDVSFGSCQATVSTAGGFGLGNGTPASTQYVHQQENNPATCVRLAAQIMSSYIRYTGIGYPQAEVAWNCGPGQPRWFLLNPTGQCYTNYIEYLGWYEAALQHVVAVPPIGPVSRPKPFHFPKKLWNRYRVEHHLHRISHHRWEAKAWLSHRKQAGGIVSKPQWFPPTRHHRDGFMTTRFQGLRYYWWPGHPGWEEWQLVHWIP